MRFDLSEEQRGIRDAVRSLASQTYGAQDLRRQISGADAAGRLWRELVGAGWPSIAVSASHRGMGLGLVELSLVCEELGAVLAPATFIANAAAATAVEYAGSGELWTRWLPGFASGESPGAMAMQQPDGTTLAFDAEGAAALLVVGPDRLTVVPATAYTLEPLDGIDVTRRLSRVTGIAYSEPLDGDVTTVLDRVEVAVAAELVGVAQRALDIAVSHATSREQFGRPIGAYQAVSHRCAAMLVDVESARSAVLSAAWTADHNAEELAFAASVAKVAASRAAWNAATGALQIHGGIGFTWEHECHLLLRRAAASARLLRGVDWHLERVASLRGLDGAVP
ncbi:MAG: acyl-CoA/acyl-ACP dehydrogenase [Candidatus Dormibacteraeota bacterium]|nr:acyl-CoA/acyl-ACP dehydrogenase [Candidatus Dormibacteraeota bacterium]